MTRIEGLKRVDRRKEVCIEMCLMRDTKKAEVEGEDWTTVEEGHTHTQGDIIVSSYEEECLGNCFTFRINLGQPPKIHLPV